MYDDFPTAFLDRDPERFQRISRRRDVAPRIEVAYAQRTAAAHARDQRPMRDGLIAWDAGGAAQWSRSKDYHKESLSVA